MVSARGSERMMAGLVTGAVAVVLGAAVIWPVLGVRIRGGEGVDVGLLVRSFGVAGLIAVLATAVALPAAWVVRGMRGAAMVVLMAPMLMPAYLAYTGWGVLRAPDSVFGKWLMMRGAGDANWYPVAAGYVLAVMGLVLWSWPLAAVIVGLRLRRVEDSVLEAMEMEVGSAWRKRWEVLWMCRGSIAAAAGVVLLVMLGSAVPLHLAQLDTYAIKVWRELDQTARGEQGKVWGSAWPLLAMAVVGGVVMARRVRGLDLEEFRARRAAGLGAKVGSVVVWCAAIVAPVGLMVWSVRGWGGIGAFLKLIGGPIVSSGVVGAGVALVTAVVAVWMWVALAGRWRRVGAGVGVMLVIAGLVPGVLVGAATAQAWARPGLSWVGESEVIVVLAHVARFGMVGAVTGWWLATVEGRWARDMRTMDAGGSVAGWWEAAVRPQVGAIGAAAVGAGLLSFHEIESTVMVQPASASGGSFAWQMLQWLHFARMDDLAMGVMVVAGMGVVGGAMMWAGVWACHRR